MIALLPGMKDIRFSYLKEVITQPGDPALPPEWHDRWDPEEDKGLPRAIKVSVVDPKTEMTLSVIARLLVNYEA